MQWTWAPCRTAQAEMLCARQQPCIAAKWCATLPLGFMKPHAATPWLSSLKPDSNPCALQQQHITHRHGMHFT